MSEILSNTGVKLWAETDYSELWLTVFDQLTGQGGKSNIRLIDEAIGKINAALDGYKFEFSSDEDRLYISKGDSKLPVSLIDSNGHVASKVDGTTITIDESGVVKGVPVDDALSEESTNPLQNKVIAGELKSIKSKMGTDESAIKQNTSDITSNTKRIEANETAISTLNGTGDGSVKKAVSDGIAEVVAGAPEDFDTLKEMSDWISTHETSASAMNSQIQNNKKAIDNHALNGDVHVTPENKTNWNKVSEKLDKTGDASNVTTEFTTATTRSNLTTKEKLSISFGKISKWFSDLKDVAFSGSYNDLNDKPTSLPASDVSAWAKEKTKPTYTKSEVGLGNVDNTADSEKSVKYATSAGNAAKVNNHTVNVDVPSGAKFTDTTYNDATTSAHGLMTAVMVTKLNGIADGANKTVVDSAMSDTSTNAVQNKVIKKYVDDNSTDKLDKTSVVNNQTTSDTGYALDARQANPNVNGSLGAQIKTINETVDTLKKSVSDGKTKVANAITGKGVKTATDATFDVMAENISKIDTELHGATLAVSTSDNELFGKTVTLTRHYTNVGTTVFSNKGTCSFIVQQSGPYTITCGEAHKDISVTNIDVLNKTTISVNLLLLKIVTFASGTDEEIAKMIQAHYNNKINIADYWAVGDTRTVSLSAMSSAMVGESHRAQTVRFVIAGFEHDTLANGINNHSKAAITLLQKDCLMDAANASNPSANGSNNTENGYMSSRQSNEGGWDACSRRGWCNNIYFNALPTAWRSMVKTVNKKATAGNISSTIKTVQDDIFLPSEIEIFGSTTYSFAGEGAQYQYYKNAKANRYKDPRWTSTYVSSMYFTRSPSSNTTSYCIVNASGNANTRYANTTAGIAPMMCV